MIGGPKATRDSIPGSSSKDEQRPRDGEGHCTFGDLCTCSSRRRKYTSLVQRKGMYYVARVLTDHKDLDFAL